MSASPDDGDELRAPRFVAIVGAPRSGTTWLQTLLASHDAIVSPQETNLFSRYVAPLDERWQWEARGSVAERHQRRFIGLGAVLAEEEFRAEVATFVHGVVEAIARLKPGASIVLEKTPSHSLHVERILRYLPDARFLHIVRDGRDVAASLVAASQGWGASWGAPSAIGAAARIWRDYVESARRAATLAPYHELRYEELRGPDAPEVLAGALAFCGVDVTPTDARERIERYSLEELRAGERVIAIGGEAARYECAAVEPEGFYRRGEVGGWASWSTHDRVAFDTAAGPLLHELGYATDADWLGPAGALRRARRSLARRRRVARVERAVASRLRRSAARLDP